MNASGLFLGANTAPTKEVSLRGLPLFSLNDRVIRQARSVDEAVEVLAGLTPATGYNIHLSHGPSQKAAVVEVSARRQAVRYPKDDLLVATNHYETQRLAKTIPDFTIVDNENTWARRARLTRCLEGARPAITVEALVGFLRDQREPDTLEVHPMGDVVCNYMNVSSVVADVTEGRLFVGAGEAPTALGGYVAFDFQKEMRAFLAPRSYPLQTLAASPTREAPEGAAVSHYILAHRELVHEGRPLEALHALEASLSHCPNEPKTLLSAGLLCLSLDRVEEARRYAQQFLENASPQNPRRHRALLLHIWCADLLGDAEAGRRHRREAERVARQAKDPSVKTEVRRFGRRRFTQSTQKKMDVDLFGGKVFYI